MAQNVKKLRVYEEAYALARDIYKETEGIQGHFRIKDQLWASSTSICTNLAEMGAMENSNQQKQKVIVCIGEANETEFWLDFCKDTSHIDEEKHRELINRLKPIRMSLYNLKKSIEGSG